MAISIPDTLTTDNSEKYIMSIRLWPGGLSFSGYQPSEGESFFYRKTEFDRTIPYITSLKEFFFENEFLSWLYKRIQMVYVSSLYTVVPEDILKGKEKEAFLSFHFPVTEKKCMDNALKADQAKIVFGIDEEMYEFCSRSMLNPYFCHHLTSLLPMWSNQSRTNSVKQMYVVLHEELIDIACYEQGRLLFVNSFETVTPDDILYYILYVWREVGLDQVKDQFYISGNFVLRNNIMNMLRTYLQYVYLMEIPSEAYLLGGEVRQAPMDLITLSICEL